MYVWYIIMDDRCRVLINLLLRNEERVDYDYLYNLREVSSCSDELQHVYAMHRKRIGDDCVHRVETNLTIQGDRQIVAHTVFHYRHWTEMTLASHLSLGDRVNLWIWSRQERMT